MDKTTATKETTMTKINVGWLKINCIVETLAAARAQGNGRWVRALLAELAAV